MSCYRHNTYLFRKTFFKGCVQKALPNLHQTAKLSAGEIELVQALKSRKKALSNKGRNRVTLFSWCSEIDFQYILFSHFSPLLSTVQYTLKTLPWKMVSHTLEQLLKGILLVISVRKHTPAFHIHLAKCAPTTIPPIKQYKHICHPYTHRESYVAGCRNINKEKKAQRGVETPSRVHSLTLVEPGAAPRCSRRLSGKAFPQHQMSKHCSSSSGREWGGGI